MYQLTFSIGADYVNWFYAVEQKLKRALDGQAIMVTKGQKSRLFIAVACENQLRSRVFDLLCDTLVDMYAVHAKRHYFAENLRLPLIDREKFNILLAALVEFDSASDRQLIRQTVALESGLNVEGVYNFAFSDVKNRWRDIGELTKENALYLTDNEIFFELIKYMFSAITPKTEVAKLSFEKGKFTLLDCSNNSVIGEADTEDELLCSVISAAPMTITFGGGVSADTRHRLNAIFGKEQLAAGRN